MSQRSSLVVHDGFGARVWLTEAEWETYRRRVAVRYPQRLRPQVIARDGETCSICGEATRLSVQLAHRIPFKLGIVDWGLTPDWLDGVDNLCLAHTGGCNDQAELRTEQIPAHLRSLGLSLNDSPSVYTGRLVLRSDESGGDVVEFRHGEIPTTQANK